MTESRPFRPDPASGTAPSATSGTAGGPDPGTAPAAGPGAANRRESFAADVLSSVVVFLVALPLCLGIALASGVPPAFGLVTGIVGGILVGFLQGSPLQVSGPAAGLTVIVLEIVGDHGIASLGAIVLAAGIIQVVAGLLRGGRWFRAVPPSVVHGMLAGIGVLIATGQFHAMVDNKPPGGGLENILAIPESLSKVFRSGNLPHTEAALVGVLTILVIVAWSKLRPERLKVVPGALVAVALATVVVNVFGLEVARVQVPDNLLAGMVRPRLADLLDPSIWTTALGVAAIASAETLLCAGALDRLHRGPRSNYNRELAAQGAGNAVCGVLGALPMTAVIVRSSTNVQAGGRTRLATILHGTWILLFVGLAGQALGLIPVSCLAAVLVATGWKLVDRRAIRELRSHSSSELAAYAVTVAGIVVVDLLVGVLAGLAVAVAILLLRLSRLSIDVEHLPEQGMSRLHLRGSATFLRLPDIAEALGEIPADAEVHVHLDELAYLDHATVELLAHWEETHRERGGHVYMDWDDLHRRRSGPLRERGEGREIVLPDARDAREASEAEREPASPV